MFMNVIVSFIVSIISYILVGSLFTFGFNTFVSPTFGITTISVAIAIGIISVMLIPFSLTEILKSIKANDALNKTDSIHFQVVYLTAVIFYCVLTGICLYVVHLFV